jgi:hypothetical protein
MQKMQLIAAPGWSVSFDEKSKTIDITRNALTSVSSNIPNPPPGQDDDKVDHFSFWLWVTPGLSKAEYAKEKGENYQTEKKIAVVYARLIASPNVGGIQRPHGPVVMPSEPYTNNPADQKNIAEYEHLKQSLHDLPDGYFENMSVRWFEQFPKGPDGAAPSSADVREECKELYRKLAAVPTKY